MLKQTLISSGFSQFRVPDLQGFVGKILPEAKRRRGDFFANPKGKTLQDNEDTELPLPDEMSVCRGNGLLFHSKNECSEMFLWYFTFFCTFAK